MYDDENDWQGMALAQRIGRARKRDAMENIAKRMKISHRIEYVNEGTILFDGRFYYYAQKQTARIRGDKAQYQMRGFKHFIEESIEYGKNNPPIEPKYPEFERARKEYWERFKAEMKARKDKRNKP